MKDIPADGIYYDEALVTVAQMLNPDTWQVLEERLNPASPYYGAFPEPDARDRAHREAERNYYNALRLADEWLQERIGRGILVAQKLDPVTGKKRRLHRHASMGDFITRITDHLAGVRQPIFFDRKSFDNAVKEIAQPTTGRVENPEQTRPAEPKLLKPAAWFDDVRKDQPRLKNEPLVTYADRLHTLMQQAQQEGRVTKVWIPKTLLRRLHDK
jgi:hypothetical protein